MIKDISDKTFQVNKIIKALGFSRRRLIFILIPYYALTILNAALEGVGMVLLVGIFTGKSLQVDTEGFIAFINKSLEFFSIKSTFPEIMPFLFCLFLFNFILRFSLYLFDGYVGAYTRQRMQELTFKRYLFGSWAQMRNFRVGDAVGNTTQEAVVVSKYLISILSALYFILSAVITSSLALYTNFKISLAFGVIVFPVFILMKVVFKQQSTYSRKAAELRNDFSSNITDRFNGLLQVHVDNNYDFHSTQALRTQDELTKLDIKIGMCQAIIGSFNLLLPLVVMAGFILMSIFLPGKVNANMAIVASVGILGVRVASQLNGAVAAVGNLSRLSGSLFPILATIDIPAIPNRKHFGSDINSIELQNVEYKYQYNTVFTNISLTICKSKPLILMGRSGSGKTTLANLIAGLYLPSQGTVEYIDQNNVRHLSSDFHPKVGFVTQDIYLFKETLRINLTAGRECSDEKIWSTLAQVDAIDFVNALGGLDMESSEAGRSLSGGQRRRLGIARVLLSGSDILIFDEITAGLDTVNSNLVLNVVEKLSKEYIIVLISHDDLKLSNQVIFRVENA
jgi:subfamily B ATP-binding cassette protein MsbA